MPVYPGSDVLNNDEWILFQIKEGPCNAGCDYCYENEHIKEVLARGQRDGVVEAADVEGMTTLELARFTEHHRATLGTEMTVDEIRDSFRILKEAGIPRAGLIGSEPTSHSEFEEILAAAGAMGLDLLVYTAGLDLGPLAHPAVKYVVLHLDYGRLGSETVRRRLEEGSLPPDNYMKKVVGLLDAGKQIHLRVNFSSSALEESPLITNFFRKIPPHLHPLCELKYSFSTRVAGDSSFEHFTPETLRLTSPSLLQFVDDFTSKFPGVRLIAERPLFPCSFESETWDRYRLKGGFLATCDMEFTFYPSHGLALCPPSRTLVAPEAVRTPNSLRERITRLRDFLRENYLKPSFDVCEPCEMRKNLYCQGGCLGYKVRSTQSEPRVVQIT